MYNLESVKKFVESEEFEQYIPNTNYQRALRSTFKSFENQCKTPTFDLSEKTLNDFWTYQEKATRNWYLIRLRKIVDLFNEFKENGQKYSQEKTYSTKELTTFLLNKNGISKIYSNPKTIGTFWTAFNAVHSILPGSVTKTDIVSAVDKLLVSPTTKTTYKSKLTNLVDAYETGKRKRGGYKKPKEFYSHSYANTSLKEEAEYEEELFLKVSIIVCVGLWFIFGIFIGCLFN